jgi:hypothetical protein
MLALAGKVGNTEFTRAAEARQPPDPAVEALDGQGVPF